MSMLLRYTTRCLVLIDIFESVGYLESVCRRCFDVNDMRAAPWGSSCRVRGQTWRASHKCGLEIAVVLHPIGDINGPRPRWMCGWRAVPFSALCCFAVVLVATSSSLRPPANCYSTPLLFEQTWWGRADPSYLINGTRNAINASQFNDSNNWNYIRSCCIDCFQIPTRC